MDKASDILQHLSTAPVLFSSQMMTAMLYLLLPVFTFLNPFFNPHRFKKLTPTNVVKKSFYYSLLPVLAFVFYGHTSVASLGVYIKTEAFISSIGFCFDKYSVAFLPVALFVSWSISQFSEWYMESDPNYKRFMGLLLIFLCAMIILVTSNHLLPFFVGWEGVGTMSFLLIGWWSARPAANIASLSAILINRYGDLAMLLTMMWCATRLTTWDFNGLMSAPEQINVWFPVVGLIISAAGKSAQFGFHPWLPAAMEGPTPVSALLHSSTMVVAGVFLALRVFPLLEQAPGSLTIIMWIGAVTTLYGATSATLQNDIKKIIAFSTTSQLGLMMVAIGLGQPNVAFSHLCGHAFFKAMLFMCAGTIIHALNNEQDIRKMGGMFKLLPITCSCFIIGNLALTGAPFLAGFFSKDAIIECLTTSPVNGCALAMTIFATSFTAIYTMRMVFFVMMREARTSVYVPVDESNPLITKPLTRLAWGSIIAGAVIAWGFVPLHIPVLTMPLGFKLAALLLSIAGLIIGHELASFTTDYYPNPSWMKGPSEQKVKKYQQGMTFYPTLYFLIMIAEYIVHWIKNKKWAEKTGPKAISNLNKLPIRTTNRLQSGRMPIYVALFLMVLALIAFLSV